MKDVFLIDLLYVRDDCGELIKDYSKEQFLRNGIDFEPVETLFITNKRYVLRGLHYP